MVRAASSKRLALRLTAILLLLALLIGLRASPAQAQGPTIFENSIVDVELERYNSCTDEFIHFTGQLHAVFFEIPSASGSAVYKSQVNPLNMVGVGEDSGTVYRGVGMSMGLSTVQADGDGTYTSKNVVNYISQEPGGNEIFSVVFHVTVAQNGEVVVVVDEGVSGCR